MLLAPAMAALLIFFVLPIGRLLVRSLFDPGITLKHYIYFFSNPLYLKVMWITLQIALMTTLASLLLGYPLAFVLRRANSGVRNVLLLAIVLSFMISLLVRNYSWIIVLQRNGVVNMVLEYFHIIDKPLKLLHNKFGVIVGMSHIFIPYIVFPIYSVMVGTSLDLDKAAQNLGASRWQTFWRVTFPLSLPGVGAGALLVFIMALGFFITPGASWRPQGPDALQSHPDSGGRPAQLVVCFGHVRDSAVGDHDHILHIQQIPGRGTPVGRSESVRWRHRKNRGTIRCIFPGCCG